MPSVFHSESEPPRIGSGVPPPPLWNSMTKGWGMTSSGTSHLSATHDESETATLEPFIVSSTDSMSPMDIRKRKCSDKVAEHFELPSTNLLEFITASMPFSRKLKNLVAGVSNRLR